MPIKLLTIGDSFEIAGRGVSVIPGIPWEKLPQSRSGDELDVELRKPDGSRQRTRLGLTCVFATPHPNDADGKLFAIFRGLHKADLPIGTEVWDLTAEDSPGS